MKKSMEMDGHSNGFNINQNAIAIKWIILIIILIQMITMMTD